MTTNKITQFEIQLQTKDEATLQLWEGNHLPVRENKVEIKPVNTDFTMSVTKPFSFKDDETFNLSYHTGPKKIPDIILGWENAGYVVTAIDERTYNGR